MGGGQSANYKVNPEEEDMVYLLSKSQQQVVSISTSTYNNNPTRFSDFSKIDIVPMELESSEIGNLGQKKKKMGSFRAGSFNKMESLDDQSSDDGFSLEGKEEERKMTKTQSSRLCTECGSEFKSEEDLRNHKSNCSVKIYKRIFAEIDGTFGEILDKVTNKREVELEKKRVELEKNYDEKDGLVLYQLRDIARRGKEVSYYGGESIFNTNEDELMKLVGSLEDLDKLPNTNSIDSDESSNDPSNNNGNGDSSSPPFNIKEVIKSLHDTLTKKMLQMRETRTLGTFKFLKPLSSGGFFFLILILN